MVTLDGLKSALRRTVPPGPQRPLSEAEYSAAFRKLRESEEKIYDCFIYPQLEQLISSLLVSRSRISILEIGPGPTTVLEYMPNSQCEAIRRYAAFEPSLSFATKLGDRFRSTPEWQSPLPCLEIPPEVHPCPFTGEPNTCGGIDGDKEKYDLVLFCHSMHGMKPERRYIERALEMLAEGGMVAVFHRDDTLRLDGLVCHRTASYYSADPVALADDDSTLDCLTPFIVGFAMEDAEVDRATRAEWRKVCRELDVYEEDYPKSLVFHSPAVMFAFNRGATSLAELTAQVPFGEKAVKNWEANHLRRPAAIVRPTCIQHVQACVRWAVEHRVGLTVLGGGHSGHCAWTSVVSVDMGAFDEVHVLAAGEDDGELGPLVVAEAGCKAGDIIKQAMAKGLTVPLGARPSVGAGLWLQGGIGHLSRLHGLTCDAIVGAVLVNPGSGRIFRVGLVPNQHRPAGSVCPDNEDEILWAVKGAGTIFGIVVSVTFKAYPATMHTTRNWVFPMKDLAEAHCSFEAFGKVVAWIPSRSISADAYLYYDAGQLHLGMTVSDTSTAGASSATLEPTPLPLALNEILGPPGHVMAVDGIGLFETDMYMSRMHDGQGGGQKNSFKRCVFLQKNLLQRRGVEQFVEAMELRPTRLCYLHLLHGGGAIRDVAPEDSAFSLRDWEFACVITAVWPRCSETTEIARKCVDWAYKVAVGLLELPGCSGIYGADLGPDPRDATLAEKAGLRPNLNRLARLKRSADPYNVLAYAFQVPGRLIEPRLIVVVTGDIGTGKDYCANVWASLINGGCARARVVSISFGTKTDYAEATGVDLNRLLDDRSYKEEQRPALTAFFHEQVKLRPRLREENFLDVVNGAFGEHVLIITGMREETPVASYSHLVAGSRLLEVRIQTSEETRRARHSYREDANGETSSSTSKSPYRPNFVFDNDSPGGEAAEKFARDHLVPFLYYDFDRLAEMVRSIPNFPRRGIEFRHILGIAQKPGGLALCSSLLKSHFDGDWAKVDAIACCEAGGFVFASALALQVETRLVLIREAGKLPSPTVSVSKPSSYISACTGSRNSAEAAERKIEMEQGLLPEGASVVVVDDVLSTGETLCAVLRLLREAGVDMGNVSVMVVAELPFHRGRRLLLQGGFGCVNVQSLLVLDGE